MPRYYCDYCDTFLTHDSPVVRKQHNTGYKHKANVRNYYMQFEEAQTQDLIDSKIMEHLARGGAAGEQPLPMISPGSGAVEATLAALRPPSMAAYSVGGGVPSQYARPAPQALPAPAGMAFRPPAVLPTPPGGMYRPPQSIPPPSQYAMPYQR